MSETPQQPPRVSKKGRSPSYPAIDLEAAIKRAEALYKHEKMHPAPITAIVKHWGYTTHKSGIASTQYAALKKFGLLTEEGSGEHRQGQLTPLAFAILHNPNDEERLAAIREAALTPPIHAELWNQYGPDLPSDANLRYRLVMERSFTDAGADDFVKEYKSTIAFAMPEVEISDDPLSDYPTDEEGMVSSAPPPGARSAPAPSSNPGRRPPMVDVWHSGGERVHMQAPEPPISPRTTRHAIPLIGGKQVVLEGEFPLTEEAWNGFMNILQAFKPGLVEPRSQPARTPTPSEFMQSDSYGSNEEDDPYTPSS